MKSSEYHKKIFVHIIPLTVRTQSSFNIIPLTARTQSSFNTDQHITATKQKILLLFTRTK